MRSINVLEAKTHLSRLLAQAVQEPLHLLTHDAALARYDAPVLLV